MGDEVAELVPQLVIGLGDLRASDTRRSSSTTAARHCVASSSRLLDLRYSVRSQGSAEGSAMAPQGSGASPGSAGTGAK